VQIIKYNPRDVVFFDYKDNPLRESIYYYIYSMIPKDRHLNQVNQNIEPKTPNGCEECLQMGSGWVHLRLCLTCGHVGCCDSSPNKHATKHFKATEHPIVRSFQPGEDWKYCYIDDMMIE
jgi:uncharacterized UBP type Zn finger protein